MAAPGISRRPPPPVPPFSKMDISSADGRRQVMARLEDFLRHLLDGYSGQPAQGPFLPGPSTGSTGTSTDEDALFYSYYFAGM